MRTWIAVWVLSMASIAAGAPDDGAAKAKSLYVEGVKHYNLGQFAGALAAFQEAYLVRPDPVFLFNIGQCHRMLNNLKDEVYAYRRYLSESPNAPNRVEVERFINSAEEEINRKRAEAPPTATMAPPSVTAPPVSEPPPERPPAAAAPAEAPSGKRWVIGAVAGGAVVVVAVVIVVAVVAAGAPAPAHPGDTAGSALVRF
jgi:tetratricopeptide (TPR) repeat protein